MPVEAEETHPLVLEILIDLFGAECREHRVGLILFVLPFLDVLAHLAPERQFALDGIRDVRRRADTVGKEVEIELFAPAFQEQRPRNLDTQSVSIAGYLLWGTLLADTDLDRFVPAILTLDHDAERKGQECFIFLGRAHRSVAADGAARRNIAFNHFILSFSDT